MLAPAAILVAFGLAVIGDIVETFESRSTAISSSPGISLLQTTVNGLNARDRVLQAFNFGSPMWAGILLLGLTVLVLSTTAARLEGEQRSAHSVLLDGFIAAAALAAAAAIVDVAVWLSYLGGATTLAVRSVLIDLGAAVIAAATLWWAFDHRSRYPAPAPAPGGTSTAAPAPAAEQGDVTVAEPGQATVAGAGEATVAEPAEATAAEPAPAPPWGADTAAPPAPGAEEPAGSHSPFAPPPPEEQPVGREEEPVKVDPSPTEDFDNPAGEPTTSFEVPPGGHWPPPSPPGG